MEILCGLQLIIDEIMENIMSVRQEYCELEIPGLPKNYSKAHQECSTGVKKLLFYGVSGKVRGGTRRQQK